MRSDPQSRHYLGFSVTPTESKDAIYRDSWTIEEGEHVTKIIRHHKFPTSRKFIRTEAESVPIEVNDEWRHRRNNLDKKKERWIGKTIFFALGKGVGEGKPHDHIGNGACVALCKGANDFKPIDLKELLVPSKVTVRVSPRERGGDHQQANSSDSAAPVCVTLHRKGKESRRFGFLLSDGGLNFERGETKIEIGLYELGDREDAFVLMCAEDDNRFERYMGSQKYCQHVPVLITADDDLLSPYRPNWTPALRSSRDACVFAGPCTAGSPWSRLNASKSDGVKNMLSLKQEMHWMLWEKFQEAYKACAKRNFAVILELPRHCEYWKDPKVQSVLKDGKCQIHELDGCMYGLVGRNKRPIKKPWKMLSWNLPVGKGLSHKCDGSHEHTPCAGSDTKSTQLYTPLIVKLIVDPLALRNNRAVRVSEGIRSGVKRRARAMCCVVLHRFMTTACWKCCSRSCLGGGRHVAENHRWQMCQMREVILHEGQGGLRQGRC